MKRKLSKDILTEYCFFAKNIEVPNLFSMWCIISAVAACLKRNCWLNLGHITIYPNLYIILVAGSARCKKSTAIRMIEGFLKKVNPPVQMYSQKMTLEAFINALAHYDKKEEDSNIIERIADGIVIVDELGVLLGRKAFETGMIDFINRLYDSHDSFSYSTIKRGNIVVPKSCVSILAGTTEKWIRSTIPLDAIGAGFTSRVIFVHKARPDRLEPIPELTKENMIRRDEIIHDLGIVSQLRGGFEFTEKAKADYIKEYHNWYNSTTNSTALSFFDDSRLDGYANRRMITLLKLSMTVAVSIKDDLVITDQDFKVALEILRNTERDLKKVMDAITTGAVGDFLNEVLGYMKLWKVCPRSKLLRQFSHKIGAREIDELVYTLAQSGRIKITHVGRVTMYEYIGDSFTEQVIAGKL